MIYFIRRILFVVMLFVFLQCVNVLGQVSGKKEILLLNGEVAFWLFEEAELNNDFIEGSIDETGTFSFVVPKPSSRDLSRVRRYIGLDCLNSSNSDSRYVAFSDLNVIIDEEEVGELYLQTPRFNFRLGEAYKEFHYYSEATVVTGRCVDQFDDGFEVIYEFPNLEVKAGWNELVGTITNVEEDSETYTFSLESKDQDYVWELEPLNVDSYSGIGASVDYPPFNADGILITDISPDRPADNVGLQVNDIIVAIDGRPTLEMPVSIAVFHLRGPAQTKVLVTVLRDTETLEFEIERAIIDD